MNTSARRHGKLLMPGTGRWLDGKTLDEIRVEIARLEVRVRQDALMHWNGRVGSFGDKHFQRAVHSADRFREILTVRPRHDGIYIQVAARTPGGASRDGLIRKTYARVVVDWLRSIRPRWTL